MRIVAFYDKGHIFHLFVLSTYLYRTDGIALLLLSPIEPT